MICAVARDGGVRAKGARARADTGERARLSTLEEVRRRHFGDVGQQSAHFFVRSKSNSAKYFGGSLIPCSSFKYRTLEVAGVAVVVYMYVVNCLRVDVLIREVARERRGTFKSCEVAYDTKILHFLCRELSISERRLSAWANRER